MGAGGKDRSEDVWRLDRGATLEADGSVRFSVWAPNAERLSVSVLGGPAEGTYALARGASGVFAGRVPHAGAGADYRFCVGSERTLPDPVSRWQPHGVHGPSRVVDPEFAWHDAEWRGLAMADLVMYELHVGTFTEEGTFAAVIGHLRGLKALGITAIELMPVAQFPGNRNWGYDGVLLYAVQDSYGGPRGLKQLVDAAHAEGLAVILDVVYNHVGPEGNYLAEYGPYFTTTYHTPWGPALNYDGSLSEEVRRFVVENALYWITEYHIDGLRLDAVHRIYDFGAKHILQEIAEALHDQGRRLGRHVLAIAESDLNDPKLVRDTVSYGYGLDGQWSDDLHHAVHALLTGERAGYYADFGGAEPVARALEEPFVYEGQFSVHRKRRHGAPSSGLPRDRFVVAIQNHDQIGNRAGGERLSMLVSPAQLRFAAALLLLSPYVPLLFMGEEYGETHPFLYFVSHGDPRLIDAVRSGRRREFESFGWHDVVPDPQADETFERSKLDRSVIEAGRDDWHAQLLELYRDLLTLRRDEPMLRPGGSGGGAPNVSIEQHPDGNASIALLRYPRGWRRGGTGAGALLILFNCSPAPVAASVPEDATGAWRLRLSTDARAYGGAGTALASEIQDDEPVRLAHADAPKRLLEPETLPTGGRRVMLPPWSCAVYERVEEIA